MSKMPSVMKHQFSQIPRADIPRSSFNRNHGYKTTFDSGKLIPFYVDEALPGDTFNLKATLFARMATPIVPVMDNLYLDTFFFAVPMRLVWENFQKFNGEQENPGDSTDYLVPQVTSGDNGWSIGSLEDYFGLPTGVPNLSVSSLWHRAYRLIYNEWFRDQNLIDSLPINKGDGPDNYDTEDPNGLTGHDPLNRCKRHDYFTSCLPWPQKGPGVELPLGGLAPIGSYDYDLSAYPEMNVKGLASSPTYNFLAYTQDVGGKVLGWKTGDNAAGNGVFVGRGDSWNASNGVWAADLSNATAATINSLRQAFQVQRLYERDARGGTRYTEIIRSHFGVVSPDARLQRPEYLGGMSTPIQINPVVQNSSTDATSPQGNLAAFGVGGQSGAGFVKSFTEHTLLIGLVNVRADLTYQQGIPRMFSRRTRFDFYWPALAHLGEQAVLNKEIFAQGTSADNEVFGYQERWAEYRYFPSKITGQFRSSSSTPLDVWHLSQKFEELPQLNEEFINENPPIDRVIAVTDEPQFLLDVYFNLNTVRPMPLYSVPGLMDHF